MIKKKIPVSSLFFVVLLIIAFRCSKGDKAPGPVSDFEGNIYRTIRIGDQVWMVENLRSTRFNDGKEIALVTDPASWEDLTTPGCCWYNNDAVNKDPYGALYNGYAIDSGKLCPAGWHVPGKEEWQQLITYLGDTTDAGGKLKETGTTHWHIPNTGADNSSGFTATGAGVRYFEGSFSSIMNYNGMWSATETGSNDKWFLGLFYGNAYVTIDHRNKNYGFSVRCIKD
jgi:uncharacterized protein (TIGR02145 family)